MPVRISRIEVRSRQAAVWAILQEQPDGISTSDIAAHIIAKFGLDPGCRHEERAARDYVRKVLNRWQAQGRVPVCDYTGQRKSWRIVT